MSDTTSSVPRPAATEVWQRGPVPDVDPWLQPVAHSLLQVVEDVERVVAPLDRQELAATPGGAASVSFHARHLVGALDRLFTYARGEQLTPEQLAAGKAEKEPSALDAAALVKLVRDGVQRALVQVRATRRESLLEPREVGRAKLPSNVLGLMFHAAEHSTRHAGQIITTAKVVRGTGRG